ncbi:MAG: hypothetical protein U0L55_00110, partial [Acutalibacteraceae bacterium]|nr:hypothetical protein [Acutalibacteraceae bacterium]
MNVNAGYYGVTKDETIYDKDGHSYHQNQGGTLVAVDSRSTMTVTGDRAYKGNKSLYLYCNYGALSTGLDVKQSTNYTFTYYVTSTGATIKHSGIATTLNISKDYVPDASNDGGTFQSNLKEGLGNFPDGIAISKKSSTVVNSTEWTKVTFDFNSGRFTKLYFVISPDADANYWIDEVSLVEKEVPETVGVKFVGADGNELPATHDSVKHAYVNAHIEEDVFEGTKIATVDYASDAYAFLGWFDANDNRIATTKSYSIKGSAEGIYAKIQINNLLTATASFEGYDVNQSLTHKPIDTTPDGENKDFYPSGAYFGGNKGKGYLGQTKEETIYDNTGTEIKQTNSGEASLSKNSVVATVKENCPHSGNNSVYLQNYFWTASMGIDVTPQTNYILSYYILAPEYNSDTHQNTIALSAISTTLNTGNGEGAQSPANVPLNSATNLYLDSQSLTNLHDGENWIKVTHKFNSMHLEKVYLVIGQTSDNNNGSGPYIDSWAYIDDMTMIEYKKAELSVEMKSCASLDLIDADMDKLYVNQELSFKVINNRNTLPTVKLNDTDVTPDSEGIYTVTLGETNTLSVRFDGDESLPWYDEDEQGRKLNENNHEVYSEPIWEGDTVYHET